MTANIYEDPRVRGIGSLETTTMPSGVSHTHRRISWAAVFGGVGDLLLGALGGALAVQRRVLVSCRVVA